MVGQPKNFTTIMIHEKTHKELDEIRGEKSFHEMVKRFIGEHKKLNYQPEADYLCTRCYSVFEEKSGGINKNKCPDCGSRSYEYISEKREME